MVGGWEVITRHLWHRPLQRYQWHFTCIYGRCIDCTVFWRQGQRISILCFHVRSMPLLWTAWLSTSTAATARLLLCKMNWRRISPEQLLRWCPANVSDSVTVSGYVSGYVAAAMPATGSLCMHLGLREKATCQRSQVESYGWKLWGLNSTKNSSRLLRLSKHIPPNVKIHPDSHTFVWFTKAFKEMPKEPPIPAWAQSSTPSGAGTDSERQAGHNPIGSG